MTAYFVWLEFGQKPIDQVVAEAMLAHMDGFGGDHRDLQASDNLVIGVQSRWQTQEDVGEQQPLYSLDQNHCLLFDGRLDNREHILSELGLTEHEDADDSGNGSKPSLRRISDGELLHRFLLRFGESRISEIIGPFAFVWLDLGRGRVSAYRDTTGGRYLCYFHNDERLIVASTERPFMALSEVGHNIRPEKIASWLFGRSEPRHLSCMERLTVLNPGQRFSWARNTPHQVSESDFYRPNPQRRIRLKDDQAYADEFRRLLDQAVVRRLRVRRGQNIGCLLSGGLDSVPIAISGAKCGADQLVAYSWVFDRSPEMDERHYSSPVCKQLGIVQKLIRCDDLWPTFDSNTHNNPLFPVALPYSEFQQHTFSCAKRDGVGVLLSGLQGDLLYETSNRQVLEPLLNGKIRQAYGEFESLRRRLGLTYLQTLKRYVLAPSRWLSFWRDRRATPHSLDSAAIDAPARRFWDYRIHWLEPQSRIALRPSQYQIVLDGFAGEDAMLGREMENKYEIERRYPFRDRELCEFLLAIPTSQLERLENKRPIVKQAYRSEFNEELLSRNDKTDFSGGLLTGIRRDAIWRDELAREPKIWRRFVKNCDFSAEKDVNLAELVVMWRCAYYNFWHRLWYDSKQTKD